MSEFFCKPGDLLFYSRTPNLSTRLIEYGERMEDPGQSVYVYHVAIALGAYDKLEADGHSVAINPIDYGKFEACRPPMSPARINRGLAKVCTYVGQRYDWPLIVDDGLRYATHNVIHLPVAYIRSQERHEKICSTLVAKYFAACPWGAALGRNASPQDIYEVVKDYPVMQA